MIDAVFDRHTVANARTPEMPRVPVNADEARLREVTRDFEAIFVKTMLDSMRNTLNRESRMFDGGMAEEFFEDMLYEQYAKRMTETARLGIADLLYQQLSPQVSTVPARDAYRE